MFTGKHKFWFLGDITQLIICFCLVILLSKLKKFDLQKTDSSYFEILSAELIKLFTDLLIRICFFSQKLNFNI